MKTIIKSQKLNEKCGKSKVLLILFYPILLYLLIYNLVVLGDHSLIEYYNLNTNYKFLYAISFFLVGVGIYLDVLICNNIKNHKEITSIMKIILVIIKVLTVLFFCFNEHTFRFLNGREVVIVFIGLQLASSLDLILQTQKS